MRSCRSCFPTLSTRPCCLAQKTRRGRKPGGKQLKPLAGTDDIVLLSIICRLFSYQTLQTEVNSHQAEIVAVGVLGHSIEGLIRAPEFERGKSINERYDQLCTNISVYQAKLQSALTTSQNFKDGLDVTIKALNELKKQLDKLPPVSRNLIELRNQAQQFKVM